jgi:two-component system, OmpR family, response regulator
VTDKAEAHAQTIVLVEDEQAMADEIRGELENKGYLVRPASIAQAADAARVGDAAMMIMDRIVFGEDSLVTLEALRKEGVKVPVLVISALSSVDEKVKGLKAGGDDYLTKPFAFAELLARVEALARRGKAEGPVTKLVVEDLELDLLSRQVKRAGQKIDLQPREFRLLEYLMRHAGQVVTRTMLLEGVWDYHFDPQTNVIDVHVSRLRQKVDKPFPVPLIQTVRNAGYMLRAESA